MASLSANMFLQHVQTSTRCNCSELEYSSWLCTTNSTICTMKTLASVFKWFKELWHFVVPYSPLLWALRHRSYLSTSTQLNNGRWYILSDKNTEYRLQPFPGADTQAIYDRNEDWYRKLEFPIPSKFLKVISVLWFPKIKEKIHWKCSLS